MTNFNNGVHMCFHVCIKFVALLQSVIMKKKSQQIVNGFIILKRIMIQYSNNQINNGFLEGMLKVF